MQFILSYFITSFITLLGKTNGVQTNAGHDNTEHALTTNLTCIFLYHFCLSGYEIYSISQKQIIMKIII